MCVIIAQMTANIELSVNVESLSSFTDISAKIISIR